MIKALADILDSIFGPINAIFTRGTGSAPAAQGGNVIAPQPAPGCIQKLVERLPLWAEVGAPTLLERLRVPASGLADPTARAGIPLSVNEVRKPATLDEAVWKASA
jgi:hypothetical protein